MDNNYYCKEKLNYICKTFNMLKIIVVMIASIDYFI